jgi:glutamate dehydrogenase/leucine dehydrogenase
LIAAIAHHDWDTIRMLLASEGEKALLNDVLYQAVDVLFPAAVQNVITEANVAQVCAQRVVEGANGPLTAEARSALYKRGVLVLPDFIVNAGGIIAAYVEMNATISPEENLKTKKNAEDAKALTRDRMQANVRKTLEIATSTGVEPALAARYLALRNIFSGE